MLNLNNFSTTRPILDLKVLLDRAHNYLKFNNFLGVIPRALELFFFPKFINFINGTYFQFVLTHFNISIKPFLANNTADVWFSIPRVSFLFPGVLLVLRNSDISIKISNTVQFSLKIKIGSQNRRRRKHNHLRILHFYIFSNRKALNT